MAAKQKVSYEFQQAAHRHLKTCEELMKIVKQFTDKEDKLKSKIIGDLYYLTGYIIECSCCWFVFSHFDYNDRSELNLENNANYNVAFDRNDNRNNSKNHNTLFLMQKHHQLREFEKIHNHFNFIPNVPILNGHTTEFEEFDCFLLYKGWQAEVRYKIDVTLTTNKVFNFLKIASNIYDGVNNHLNNPN